RRRARGRRRRRPGREPRRGRPRRGRLRRGWRRRRDRPYARGAGPPRRGPAAQGPAMSPSDRDPEIPTHLYTDAGTGELRERRFRLQVTGGPDRGLERDLELGTTMVGTHPNND